MTAEEAIAAIAADMKTQAEEEKYLVSDPRNCLFVRARSYLKISEIIEQITGEPTGITKPH